MAEQDMVITLKWENGSHFFLKTNKNGAGAITDIRIEENSRIEVIWPAVQSACISRVNQILSDIGKEMRV